MTPDERDLRRALEARSGEPSPEFRSRLSSSFDEGRPASGPMPAIAVVVVFALTLGTVGVLMMSRNARLGPSGSLNGPRYTVTASLMAARGGPLNACFFMPLPLPPIGCGGVEVSNVDVQSIPGVVTYSNGTVGTPIVKLVGTWDGHVLHLTEKPQPAKPGESTQPTAVKQAPPLSSKQNSQQVIESLKHDSADLKERGIILISFGAVADGVDMTVAVADDKTVQYLYGRYGRVYIKGWMQPLEAVVATPTIVPPTGIYLPTTAQLSASSRDVVWSLVADRLLFRSTNRGDTWEARSVPPITPGGFQEISFIDAQQGWYLTGPVIETQCKGAATQIWHTNDGAATWRQVVVDKWTVSYTSDNAAADPQCKQGLSFVDPLHGFIAAWASGRHPTMYRTLDGGKNWAGADLPDPPDFKTGPGFSLRAGLVKRFGSTMYVIASGKQGGDIPDRQYLFRSTDGGASWSWTTKIPSPYVVMVSESRWLQLVVPGQSMESTSSGQQWHPYASDFNTDTPVGGPQIVFADSQVGYAEGRGALQRTIDGGFHWARIATPGTPTPNPLPSPSLSQAALLPVTDPGFTCRLPVGTGSFGNPSNGGFVAVPRGAFELDPAAPRDTGAGFAFDAPFSRWVPVRPEAISIDGALYAWTERETRKLHVTKVADGSDRSFVVEAPSDPDLQSRGPVSAYPLAVTKDSVWLTFAWEGAWGVWRLGLANGSLVKLTGLPGPSYGAGAIWLTLQRGPNRVGMYSDGDTLARLDLASGAVVDWFHRDNMAVGYLGIDGAGIPWVEAITRQSPEWIVEIWRVHGPGQADLIISGQRISRVITDSHGTWFANETGAYLYAGGRLQRVSSASVGEVVGPCI